MQNSDCLDSSETFSLSSAVEPEPFTFTDPYDAEDSTIRPLSVTGPVAPESGVRAVIVDDTDSDRTIERPVPHTLELAIEQYLELIADEDVHLDESNELENIDETRVYSKNEWEDLLALMNA